MIFRRKVPGFRILYQYCIFRLIFRRVVSLYIVYVMLVFLVQ